jgi:hypothetical protein
MKQQELILKKEAEKIPLFIFQLHVRNPLVVSNSQRNEEQRLTTGSEKNENLEPMLNSGIFKCISWLNGSFFGGDDWGFVKKGVKAYSMAPISPLLLPDLFFFLP